MGNKKKLFEKVYTADFILLFVSFAIPFGWTMSGFPPCIELACVCWFVTLMAVLHCFWVWTQKWNKIVRVSVVILIPALIIGFSWIPTKRQYNLQHHPPSPLDLNRLGKQWHLKITGLEYVPKDTVFEKIPPFRIVAKVNDLDCSFPNEAMFYFGVSTNRQDEQGDAILPAAEKYKVNFHVIIIPDISPMGMVKMAQSMKDGGITNMPVPTISGRDIFFEPTNLPAARTNEIYMIVPKDPQLIHFHGDVRIFYEITQ